MTDEESQRHTVFIRKITGAYMDKIKITWLSKANTPSDLLLWLEMGLHKPFKNWLFV